jgi:hypothetical protein
MSVARELAEYKLYLEGLQEVRCEYAITEMFFCGKGNKTIKWEYDFICVTEEYQKLRE